jgi:L-lactate dehydrogenase complex protein LldF
MLATSGTGQQVTVYNSIITGPRNGNEVDGPEEMYVILLDNGRTNLLADAQKREALQCIRCGACLNACPVYKNIGGHTYDTTYSGPIGSVITPHLAGMEKFKHLSYASSLCGGCTAVCPVKIDIHNMLLLNRKQAVDEGLVPKIEQQSFWAWRIAMTHRWLLNLSSAKMKTWFLKIAFGNTWGKRRESMDFPKATFGQLWKERNKR